MLIKDNILSTESVKNKDLLNKLVFGLDKTGSYLGDQKWNIFDIHKLLIYAPELNIDSIGKTKLPLYNYQRSLIKEILDWDGSALIVASCGAGKTPIAIDLFLELKSRGRIMKQGLVVVKSSLKVQWFHEVKKFSDLTPSIVETTAKAGKKKYTTQFDGDLLICNYETLNDEIVRAELLERVDFVFADEVQYVKNYQAKRSKSLYHFNHLKYIYGATATPIQNNPRDIFGIFRFIDKDMFPNISTFDNRYVKKNHLGFIIGSKNEDELKARIKNHILIRTKDEVSSYLPKLVVTQKYCELGPKVKKSHDLLLEEIQTLKNQQEELMTSFRSPEEARKNEEFIKLDNQILMKQTFAQEITITDELLLLSDSKQANDYFTGEPSNKISLFLDLVESILEEGEKVCVFSRFRSLQEILIEKLTNRFKDIGIRQIHGSMNSEQRHKSATDFNDNKDVSVLLLSGAGNEGINLQAAKYLIEMEPSESYLVQTQRHGRIERASSNHKTVFVYQLIAEESYDEVALRIINKKEKYHNNLIIK